MQLYDCVVLYVDIVLTTGGSEPNLLLGERKVVVSQILLDGAQPHGAGTSWLGTNLIHAKTCPISW